MAEQNCAFPRAGKPVAAKLSRRIKPKPHGAVLAWFEALDGTRLFLSGVTLGKIQASVEMSRDRDAAKANEIEASLDVDAASYEVLPADAMMATTADVHGLAVVTRNVADFKSFGVALLNPIAKT